MQSLGVSNLAGGPCTADLAITVSPLREFSAENCDVAPSAWDWALPGARAVNGVFLARLSSKALSVLSLSWFLLGLGLNLSAEPDMLNKAADWGSDSMSCFSATSSEFLDLEEEDSPRAALFLCCGDPLVCLSAFWYLTGLGASLELSTSWVGAMSLPMPEKRALQNTLMRRRRRREEGGGRVY